MVEGAFDLYAIVRDVLNGRQSVQLARRQIASQQLLDSGQLFSPVFEQLQQLARESSSGRAHDLGLLLLAASRRVDPGLEVLVDLVAGSRLLDLGAYGLAREFLDDLRARHDETKGINPSVRPAIECLALHCRWLQAEKDAVIGDLPPALALARSLHDTQCVIFLLELGAQVASHLQASAALADLDEAIALRTAFGSEPATWWFLPLQTVAELWMIRGNVARAAGRFEDALSGYERARQLALDADLAKPAAYLLSEIAITWQQAGEEARAAEMLRQAALEAEQLGDRRAVLRWRRRLPGGLEEDDLRASDTLANALRLTMDERLDAEAALTAIRNTIEQAQEERLPGVEVIARNLLGYLYMRQGAFFRARMAFEEALRLAQSEDSGSLELAIRLNLCMTLINLRDLREAQQQLEQTIAQGERLRAATPSAELRKSLGGRLVVAYEWLMRIYLGWEYTDGTPGQPRDEDRYLRLSQGAQATNLAAWLAFEAASETIQSPEVTEAARAFRAIEARIERAAAGRAALGLLLEERERRQRILDAAMAKSGHPSTTALSPIAGLGQLTASLPPRTVLVDLFAAQDDVLFAAVAGDGTPRCGAIGWGRRDRLAFLDRWEAALAAARTSLGSDEEVRGWRLRADPWAGRRRPVGDGTAADDLEALLAELGRCFLAPLIESGLGGEAPARIYLSPHRELYGLPFWALSRYLPDVAFSILPTVGCLPLLAGRVREPGGRRFKIGDATETLPFSQLELDSLQDYEGLPARIAVILEHAPEARMVHFAGHGIFDDLNPYDSGLIVESAIPDEIAPDLFVQDSGWTPVVRRLSVTGVLSKLQLSSCSLVVLSACCTGLPQPHPASEFTSLPAAFLVAGARNVVGSLWPTHDGATALLMQEFYAQLRSMGDAMAPSVALGAARQQLARMPRQQAVQRLGAESLLPAGDFPFASPLFTMPFQSYGVD